jgi:hypothetical protein
MFSSEGGGFFDPKTFKHGDQHIWLHTSRSMWPHALPILRKLHASGCKISEVDRNGYNCLFLSIMHSYSPIDSREFERLQFLLSVFDRVYAQDVEGCTIFDLVNGRKKIAHWLGSYPRDLLYCALERAGIDISDYLARHPRIGVYETTYMDEYTPEHYHALKHLQSWNVSNFRSQMDRLLQEIPLDEEESLEMERILEEREEWRKRKREWERIREIERRPEEVPAEWTVDEDSEDDDEDL